MAAEDQFRIGAINSLAREIGALTGGGFETWCYRLIKFLEPKFTWKNRGTTLLAAPVGHTIDSSGNSACYAAQYSSAQDYFESNKPVNDLNSTVKKHPHVKLVWLLAAASGAPSDRTEIDNKITNWKLANPGVEVRLLDGREIATYIVDNLDSDALVSALQERLPSLIRLAEENALSHSLPDRGSYVHRPETEAIAEARLRSRRYVILSGLSGTGKSDLAVQLARKVDVDSRIWLDASKFQRPEDLKSVALHRRGVVHNVEYLLRDRRCVVVLDNLTGLWPEQRFSGIVGPNSFVIVTSQAGGKRDDIAVIGNTTKDIARRILELDASHPCPEAIFDVVWQAAGGHPLLLRLLGRLAANNGDDWDLAKQGCETIVTHGLEQNEKVCKRVLKQHLPALEDELAFFRWCDTASVDAALLAACVSPLAAHNLEARQLLAAASDRTVRLHDIVFKSAESEVILTPERVARYRRALDKFIVDENKKENLVIERVARRHNDLFSRELARARSPAILYALARARMDPSVISAFGDLLADAEAIGRSVSNDISVRSIIEAIEATYSLTAEEKSKKEAKSRLQSLMPAFEIMEKAPLPGTLRQEIRHHRAKMLTRIDAWDEAEAIFGELLKENDALHATKLQLVRVLARDRKTEATAMAAELIGLPAGDLAATVRIAAWVELARMQPEEVANRIDEIRTTLRSASARDAAAAYGLVAQVGSCLVYNNPDAALALFDEIKDGEPTFPSDRERQDWARAQVVAAKALLERSATNTARGFLERACSTYEAVRVGSMSEYHLIQYSEALLLLDRPDEAKAALERASADGRSEFWWYRYAKAQLRIGNVADAYAAIDRALSVLKDEKYRSAFLEVRYEVRVATNDDDAEKDLVMAVSLASNPKYKQQLQQRLTRQ
jgi:hypothetical protein